MRMPVSGWSAVTGLCASFSLAYALDTQLMYSWQAYAHVTPNASWLMFEGFAQKDLLCQGRPG